MGPVTVHLVAFDRAGNVSTYDYSGVVSNNAPRIAGMKIGTDENGNGSVDDSELITTYSGRYEKGYENGDSEKPVTEAEFPVQSAADVPNTDNQYILNFRISFFSANDLNLGKIFLVCHEVDQILVQ